MLSTTKRKSLLGVLATVSLTAGLGLVASGANAASAPAGTVITGLSAAKGSTAGGTGVLITGTGFGALASPGVQFGAVPAASIIVISDTQMAVKAPAGTGKVDIKLVDGSTVYDGLATAIDDFTYLAPYDASVVADTLMSSLGGSVLRVTSTGANWTGAADAPCTTTGLTAFTNNKVTATVNGVAATKVACVSPTEVDVTVPAGTIGTTTGGLFAKVALLHDGVVGAADTTHAKYAAVISGLDRVTGPTAGGGNVVVSGKGFTSGATWKFGDAAATCTPVTGSADTKVSCVLPAHAAGAVSVNFVPNDGAAYGTTSKASFSYSDLG